MENLIKMYEKEWEPLHPVERASYLHIIFVKIHPFIDGNGRTARLLLNLELMKNGYPPIIIEHERRSEYYSVLDKAQTTENVGDFIQLVLEALNKTFDLYFKVLR